LQFYRLGNLVIGWKLGVKIHTIATIVQWYNRMLQYAQASPPTSPKSCGEFPSLQQFSWCQHVQIYVSFSGSVACHVIVMWFQCLMVFCLVCEWFSLCVSRDAILRSPPLRNSKHSVGFSVSVSKIYVWFSRRICLRHFWCSRQSRRRRVAMYFGKRICDLIPVSMLSICIDHTKRMRWTTLCGRHVVLCGTCCCSCVLVK
jgi:hypothetical protein